MQFLLLPKPICAHNDHQIRCDQDAVWGAFSDKAPGHLVAVLCGYHRRKWEGAQLKAERDGIVDEVRV